MYILNGLIWFNDSNAIVLNFKGNTELFVWINIMLFIMLNEWVWNKNILPIVNNVKINNNLAFVFNYEIYDDCDCSLKQNYIISLDRK